MDNSYLIDWAIEEAQYKKEQLDDRGLIPIDEARKILEGFECFSLGKFLTSTDKKSYREGDVIFAALCSLENSEEFLKVVSGKEWKSTPGSLRIEALPARYMDGILPWLESMLVDNNFPEECCGREPANLHECLYLLKSDEAAELALKIERPKNHAHVPYFLSWLEKNPEKENWFMEKVNSGDKRAKKLNDIRENQFFNIPKVKKILKDAEEIAINKGKVLTLTRIQEHFDNYGTPVWINDSEFCGAVSISGFADPINGDCLIIQSLVHGSAYDGITRVIYKIGGEDNPSYTPIARTLIVPGTSLYDNNGTPISQASIKIPNIKSEVQLSVLSEGLSKSDLKRLKFKNSHIENILTIRLGQEYRDHVFLKNIELKDGAKVSEDAVELFRFESFNLPGPGEDVRKSLDILTMMEALKHRRAIKALPCQTKELDCLLAALKKY